MCSITVRDLHCVHGNGKSHKWNAAALCTCGWRNHYASFARCCPSHRWAQTDTDRLEAQSSFWTQPHLTFCSAVALFSHSLGFSNLHFSKPSENSESTYTTKYSVGDYKILWLPDASFVHLENTAAKWELEITGKSTARGVWVKQWMGIICFNLFLQTNLAALTRAHGNKLIRKSQLAH